MGIWFCRTENHSLRIIIKSVQGILLSLLSTLDRGPCSSSSSIDEYITHKATGSSYHFSKVQEIDGDENPVLPSLSHLDT